MADKMAALSFNMSMNHKNLTDEGYKITVVVKKEHSLII